MKQSYFELLGIYMYLILRRPLIRGTGALAKHDQTIARFWEQLEDYPTGEMTRDDCEARQAVTQWRKSAFINRDYKKVEEILTRERRRDQDE